MIRAELSESIRQFSMKWSKKGKEDEDDRSFWIDLFQRVLEIDNATDLLEFQKKVIVNDTTKKIDVYIPDTKVIIEQKSNNKNLDEKILQGDGEKLTPYEQAERYNNHLPHSEKARWIVTSNFKEIWIYDMDKNDRERDPIKIDINALADKYTLLKFLVKEDVEEITDEEAVSVQAGDIVGLIYDAFLEEYGDNPSDEDLKELNKLCVRLVFCLYAEDAGLFENNAFYDYLLTWNVENMNSALEKLFVVLDTPEDKRRSFLDKKLDIFPYVNGELFKDKVEIPPFTEKIRDLLLYNAARDFDWSKISPTIFGAVFESTLNPETRRSKGMHYTSVENIHKVIDPLFLEELEKEYNQIVEGIKVPKTRIKKLYDFQEKLASLKFLDPACGSGNFLTETYLSLRHLENKVLKSILDSDKKHAEGQMGFGNYLGEANPIKVSIDQFYGIEINDFAVTVARTAMWIAENQMMQETAELLFMDLDFLPLKSYTNIVEANALRIDWNDILPSNDCDYVMGNPPFVANNGRTKGEESHSKGMQSEEQKKDKKRIFGKEGGVLDYVACWYKIASDYIKNTNIEVAFVSTDSICQGQQIPPLWKPLFDEGIKINFAYEFFKWKSEASSSATVYVVIVGFGYKDRSKKYLYSSDGKRKEVSHINAYLVDLDDIFIEKRNEPLCDVPKMIRGSQATDGGNFLLTQEEKDDIIKNEPLSAKYIYPFKMGEDMIKGIDRYCLWLVDCDLQELKQMPMVAERVKKVREKRLQSKKQATVKKADTPMLFDEIKQPNTNYLAYPIISTPRRIVPICYFDKNVIAGNKLFVIPGATLYEFGVITSNVHMAWMRATCSWYGPSYQYSNTIVYNNFPWPSPSKEQRMLIEKTAQGILDARNLFPKLTLADLYDGEDMPDELREAHRKNDIAVMRAYGFDVKNTSTEYCVAKLMEMYQELTKE